MALTGSGKRLPIQVDLLRGDHNGVVVPVHARTESLRRPNRWRLTVSKKRFRTGAYFLKITTSRFKDIDFDLRALLSRFLR